MVLESFIFVINLNIKSYFNILIINVMSCCIALSAKGCCHHGEKEKKKKGIEDKTRNQQENKAFPFPESDLLT